MKLRKLCQVTNTGTIVIQQEGTQKETRIEGHEAAAVAAAAYGDCLIQEVFAVDNDLIITVKMEG